MSRSTLHIVNNHEEMVLWVIYTDTDMKENHNYLQGLKYKNYCCIRFTARLVILKSSNCHLSFSLIDYTVENINCGQIDLNDLMITSIL